MTTDVAVLPQRDGEEETSPEKEGSEGQVVTTLAQILGSADPETAFLDAISDGAIPDEICLELAEHLGELVKVANFDNRLEVVLALRESGAISEKTQQYLLLAILEMDEQGETEVEVSNELIEITVTVIPLPVATDQALEVPSPTPNDSEDTRIADLVRSAAELQAQFGTNLPEDEQSKIRQAVGKLTEEEFASLRQTLGSAILAEAEIPTDQRGIDVSASLEVVDILLGQRQAELTAAAFTAYEVLFVHENFRLIHRNGHDRPLMTVSSVTSLRNRFQSWLDSHNELSAQSRKILDVLELFELGAIRAEERKAAREGREIDPRSVARKETILRQRAERRRKLLIRAGVSSLDAVNGELVRAQPATKEGALQQVGGYLRAKRAELASELRAAGSAILGEAEATIRQLFDLQSACAALRREVAELEASDYNPLAQRPALTDAEKRLTFYELERKELDSIRLELEAALKEEAETPRNRKKLLALSAITAGKLQELDQLAAGLRPALDPVKLALPVTGQEVCHG